MKKYLIFIFLLLVNLTSCNTIKKENLELSLFVASDLHLYSSNLISETNTKYTKYDFASDGRVQEFDYDLVNSLVKEVNKEKPEYLVLTGDLSYNGEKDSLLEVKRLLNEITATKVLVIPGNHDCFSLNAFSILNDEIKNINGVTQEEFKEIFFDFGYNNAYSLDEHSLSYIYPLSENKWALMLDTNQSEYNYEYSMNIVSGFLIKETMDWLKTNLEYAKSNNIEVISFSHHNLLVHNELFYDSFTLYNNSELIDLFTEYNVKLNFSGHLHIQSIKKTMKDQTSIYDISSGSLIDYGNRYGRLDIYSNCYDYKATKLTLDSLNLEEYSYNTFYQKFYDKTILSSIRDYGEELGRDVCDLLSKINAYYFDGEYEKIYDLKIKNKKIYEAIKEKTKNYEESYTATIIEVVDKNQHNLLIEK